MIYFTSDTHFNHTNILKYEPETRPFETIEEMNETLIANWNNVVKEEDTVYVLGDFFMGMLDAIEPIYNRLNGKVILIRGNHDLLFEDLCYRGFPYSHDKHNGTVRTVQDLGGSVISRNFENCCEIALNKTKIYRDQLVNYFETENYIFVHSWIPTSIYFKGDSKPWYQRGKVCSWLEDWRNASDEDWESAMWGNPFLMAQTGLNKTGKTIVFGHWHCSAGHALNNVEGVFSEFDENAYWEPYENKEQGIIGIDRCTVHTGEVNVFVIEDNFLSE